jgi:hypothetical protein
MLVNPRGAFAQEEGDLLRGQDIVFGFYVNSDFAHRKHSNPEPQARQCLIEKLYHRA